MTQIQELRDELDELSDRECCGTCGEMSACGEDDCGYDEPLDADERERLAELRMFEESIPDWHSLIHEDGFEDYAQSYAEEVSGIDTSAWPVTCIDWARAADELRSDFTAYEIDGVTFYGRD